MSISGLLLKVLSTVAFVFCSATAAAETLEIPGTGACEVVLKDLAAAFNAHNPGTEVLIPSSVGSVGGIRMVQEGQSILARVGRPLQEGETDLSYRVFARDLIVFAAGSRVKATNLSSEQLVQIFSGSISNWSQVGGGDGIIRVLLREPGDSSLRVIKEHISAFKSMTLVETGKVLYHDYEVVEMLGKFKNSIGWLTRSSVLASAAPIKLLALDGIEPSPENALSGKYRLTGDYAFVFKKDGLNEAAKRFIEFTLSESGKDIMKKYDLLPPNGR